VTGGRDIAASGRLVATDALDHQFDNPSEELLWQIISGLTAGDNYFVMVQHVPDSSKDGRTSRRQPSAMGASPWSTRTAICNTTSTLRSINVRRAYEVVCRLGLRAPRMAEMLAWEPDY